MESDAFTASLSMISAFFFVSESKDNMRDVIDSKFHRSVNISLNMRPTMDILAGQLKRLITEIEPNFKGANAKWAKKFQKVWFGKQLHITTPDKGDITFGYIYFSVTNHQLMEPSFLYSDDRAEVTNLKYSLHVKQINNYPLGRNYTAGRIDYDDRNGEIGPSTVDLVLANGTDIESAVLYRDLILEVKSQLETFKADDSTLIAANEFTLIPMMSYGTVGRKPDDKDV